MAASVAHDDARHLDPTAVDPDPDGERAVGTSGASGSRDGDDTEPAANDPADDDSSTSAPECPAGLPGVIGVTSLPKPRLELGRLQEEER